MPITINGSGTITGISAGGLPDNCVTAADLATTLDLSSNTVTLPSGTGGKILQVAQAQETAALSWSVTAQGQWKDVLTANITPVAANSNILIMWYTSASANVAHQRGSFRLSRGGTVIGVGDTNGSKRPASHAAVMTVTYTNYSMHFSQNFLDDPTYTVGNQLSYTLQIGFEQSAGTIYVNRTAGESDDNSHMRGATYVQLLEVAA